MTEDKNQELVPKHLAHKPIFTLEGYHLHDGKNSPNETDAKGMSIGISQWSNIYLTEMSAKIWRYTNGKWSRQSEELPLHRLIDLTTFLCSVIFARNNLQRNTSMTIDGEAVSIQLSESGYAEQNLELLDKFLAENKETLDTRLRELSNTLKNLGY